MTVGSVRLDPLVRRFGLGEADGEKADDESLEVEAGEAARDPRSNASGRSCLLLESFLSIDDTSSDSVFARWKASYRLPTCDK